MFRFFKKKQRRNQIVLPNDEYLGFSTFGSSPLTLPMVFATVKMIAEDGGRSLFYVNKVDKDGRSERVNHSINKLIKREPSMHVSAMNFKMAIITSLLLHGEAYIYAQRNRAGTIMSMYAVHPYEVTTKFEGHEEFYTIRGTVYSSSEVLHIIGYSEHTRSPTSIVQKMSQWFKTTKESEDYSLHILKNKLNPSMILTPTNERATWTPVERQSLKENLAVMNAGATNAGKIMMLPPGYKFDVVKMSQEDIEAIKTKKFQIQQWSAITRVPMYLLGDMDKTAYSNINELRLAYVRNAVVPYLEIICQALSRFMFLEHEKNEGYEIRFSTANISESDTKTTIDMYKELFYTGAITTNELRIKLDMPVIPGGDKRYIQTSLMAVERADMWENETEENNEKKKTKENNRMTRDSSNDKISFFSIIGNRRKKIIDRMLSGTDPQTVLQSLPTLALSTDEKEFLLRRVSSAKHEAGEAIRTFEFSKEKVSEIIDDFSTKYIDDISGRIVGKLHRKIARSLQDMREGVITKEVFEEKIKKMGEEEAITSVANTESARITEGVKRKYWLAAGILQVELRVSGNETCDFCRSLANKAINIFKPIVSKNTHVSSGNEIGVPRRTRYHPPLHTGCTCTLVPIF